MSLNWANVKSLAIPVGGVSRDVKRVSIGGAVVWEKPSPLPYDAEVEYLESTGTQYINTGIIVDSSATSAQISFAATKKSSGDNSLFGSYESSYGIYCFAGSSALRTRWGGPKYVDISYTLGDVIDVNIHNGSATVMNRATGASRSFAVGDVFKPYPLVVAGSADGSNIRISSGARLFRVKIGDVRDLIPVRKGTVGYLYDRVSGKLFGNAGTGDFIVGPDVVPVEYIESHGTEYINTGVVPTSLTKWDIDAQFTSSDYGQIMGRGGDPALNPRFAFGLDIQSGGHGLTWYCGMGNVNTWNGIFDTFRHAFSLDAPHKTFTIDTTSYGVPLSSIGDTTIMQLFARFVNGSVQNFCKAKIFKSSIIDNGLPVRSFHPVRVGTDATSWEGAMMDVLTRRIYRNAGTGAFGYGNDLPYPIGG